MFYAAERLRLRGGVGGSDWGDILSIDAARNAIGSGATEWFKGFDAAFITWGAEVAQYGLRLLC
jgi:hypothetical protein